MSPTTARTREYRHLARAHLRIALAYVSRARADARPRDLIACILHAHQYRELARTYRALARDLQEREDHERHERHQGT